MATVIKVKSHLEKALRKKLEEVNNPTTMLAIHNTLAKKCDPYVPFLEGPLSQTIEVTSEGVHYIQPYARRQYFGENFNHTTEHHPLASAKWDEAMMRDKGISFYTNGQNALRDIVKASHENILQLVNGLQYISLKQMQS